MPRLIALAFACLLAVACGSSPAAPAPAASTTTTSIPVTTSITGLVTVGTSSVVIPNAVVSFQDGVNAGKSATSDGSGRYTIGNLSLGGFTAAIAAPGYIGTSRGITLTATAQTVNWALLPSTLFAKAGVGDTVFDMPTYISRIRITATPGTACQNFVVKIAGRLIVNVILGTCSVADARTHDGTYAVSGGVTEVQISTSVSWAFNEVR